MKCKQFIKFNLCLIFIIGLSGCAVYKARPLPRLNPADVDNNQSIGFAYHIFTEQDCKKFLDREVIKKGYQPVHITIINNYSLCGTYYVHMNMETQK